MRKVLGLVILCCRESFLINRYLTVRPQDGYSALVLGEVKWAHSAGQTLRTPLLQFSMSMILKRKEVNLMEQTLATEALFEIETLQYGAIE